MNGNDAAEHDFEHVLSVVQQQMRELAVLQQRRSEITATATAAAGTVKITVDAQRMVINAAVDESYRDEFELADLGGHIVTAAQQAAAEIEERSAALLAPLTERRKEISSLITNAPSFDDLLTGPDNSALSATESVNGDDGRDEVLRFPTVRG